MDLVLVRLNKENPKKCSLTPLRESGRAGIRWFHCDLGDSIPVGEVTLLHPEGEPLTPKDADRPLLLVDSSWRDLPRVLHWVEGDLRYRSLPPELQTAYPRKSKIFEDPQNGLASIEALHAALCMLGKRDDSLLDGYRWRKEWLDLNSELLGA
ncbi:MAG: DUF367 domain-containing protein [Planctomycetota bacterium]|nr:DUF367 domain-containing protein [Planctomycetota bacterium]